MEHHQAKRSQPFEKTMITALIATITLLTILFIWRINFGLLLVVFFLPFEKFGTFALNSITKYPIVRPVQVIAAALVLAYLICLSIGRLKMPRLNGPIVLLLSLVGWAVVPAALINYGPLWKEFVFLVFVCSISFVFSQLTTSKTILPVLITGSISLVFVILLGFAQLLSDLFGIFASLNLLSPVYSRQVLGFTRIHSTLAEPLFLANFLLAPILTTLAILLRAKKVSFGLYLLLIALAATFVLTVSRGGIIALMVGLACLIYLILRGRIIDLSLLRQNASYIMALLLLATMLGIGLLSLKGSVAENIYAFVNPGNKKLLESGSYSERKRALNTALAIIKEKPIVGLGVGGYSFRVHNYPLQRTAGDRVAINNQYIEILAELGIVGLCLFIGLITLTLYHAHSFIASKADNRVRLITAGLASGLVAILVQYLFFSGFYITYFWVLLGAVIGLSSSSVKLKHSMISAPSGKVRP